MLKIGICDDQEILRNKLHEIVCECLSELKMEAEIYIYSSGKEVISDSKKLDLLFLDIEMPEMDGHRLTKLVKEDPETADIPIIIFSSLVNDEMKRKGAALGADEQLSKPEIGNLVRVIDELTR